MLFVTRCGSAQRERVCSADIKLRDYMDDEESFFSAYSIIHLYINISLNSFLSQNSLFRIVTKVYALFHPKDTFFNLAGYLKIEKQIFESD